MKRLLSIVLSLSLVFSFMPVPALADMADGAGAAMSGSGEQLAPEGGDAAGDDAILLAGGTQGSAEGATVLTIDAGSDEGATGDEAVTDETDSAEGTTDDAVEGTLGGAARFVTTLAAQIVVGDPYYFVDYQTGNRVATLHTSGTYEVVNPDGTPYTERLDKVSFDYVGIDVRGNMSDRLETYDVAAKQVTDPDTGDIVATYLENLADVSYGDRKWQLPTGSYRIKSGVWYAPTYSKQTYRIVNDGLFKSGFDFSSSYLSENQYEFSVKSYDAGKSDEDYDEFYYDWEDDGRSKPNTPEQEPFALASDTRLKFRIYSSVLMGEGAMPQIESIGLWKADETVEAMKQKYANVQPNSTSRVPALLGKAGLSELPTWPNVLNVADSSKTATLWERGGTELNERIELDAYYVANGTCMDTEVIVDHANFSDAVAESGLYFPIVTATIAGETYVYAYFPIEVNAEGTAGRGDPRIATESFARACVGDAYSAKLACRSGLPLSAASADRTVSWAVTAGSLPAGLALDSATGVISGTPTEAGEKAFAVTLTETYGGASRTANREYAIRVLPAPNPETALDELALGEIGYTPGTVWMTNKMTTAYTPKQTYIDLSIPISLDVSDPRYNLAETELCYMLNTTSADEDYPTYLYDDTRAADLMSEDGTTLEVHFPLPRYRNLETITAIRAFLVPKDNNGAYIAPGELMNQGYYSEGDPFAVESLEITLAEEYGARPGPSGRPVAENQRWSLNKMYGDYSYYANTPEKPYTALDDPDITIGSWIRFPSLAFKGDPFDSIVTSGRVRLWPYDGSAASATPAAQQVQEISRNYRQPGEYGYVEGYGTATFKLAPGTYAVVVEGEIPIYDENGVETGAYAWVDIASSVEGATPLEGTTPCQYLLTVKPNVGSDSEPEMVGVSYGNDFFENAEAHEVSLGFQQEDGSYAAAGSALNGSRASYQVSWYRRAGADESSDVLVATGDYVLFGPSIYDLYVEVTPLGSSASFWKSTGRVKVSDRNKTVNLQVQRKPLFRGMFTLSCASGKQPAPGESWGLVEVKTPLAGGGVTSFNIWAYDNPVTVPNITSGSTVTFTPRFELVGGSVSYDVPPDVESDFTAALEAPLPQGMIDFGDLRFIGVDGQTVPIAFDDGATEVKVERVVENMYSGVTTLESVPFYIADGASIVLQPEVYYGDYYLGRDEDTIYRITITHRDADAPTCLGTMAPDYAARATVDVALSRIKTQASEDDLVLLSRGYALVPMENPGKKACTLLIYDAEGQLVDKGTAGFRELLRTPFLDAGTYTLYAVDSNCLGQRTGNYDTIENLERRTLTGAYADRGSFITFEIEDGTVTKAFEALDGSERVKVKSLSFRDWTSSELIDQVASSVGVDASYKDKVSITMHAELAQGVQLAADARLELVTNQPSGIGGEGYMNPKALNMNGRALTLDRWGQLFNQTQRMSQGNLTILLSEASKINPACATFPLDMTLVIPRVDTTCAEASIWLVSGSKRSLVGTCRQESHEASIVAPPIVAWKTFYVYGDTGPNANVAIFLNGMRAGTTKSDSYGYYTAEVSLPDNAVDFEAFTLSATAQWANGDRISSATSETTTVRYSTTFPVVEKITICYQSQPGEQYNRFLAYYRGSQLNKYATLYRAEHDSQTGPDAEHAKCFWLVEFANGDNVKDVTVGIPRSTSSITCQTTDELATAESWIDDVQLKAWRPGEALPRSECGRIVREALEDGELHAFVSKPVYLNYSADEITVDFDIAGVDTSDFVIMPMEEVSDLGTFAGFQNEAIDDEGLESLFDALGQNGSVLALKDGAGDGADSLDSSAFLASSERATLAKESSSVDEWLVVSYGDAEDAKGVKLRHQMSAEALGYEGIQQEIQAKLDEAMPVVDAYESWLVGGPAPADQSLSKYKGNWVFEAGGVNSIGSESGLYLIDTFDDEDNAQMEVLSKYRIEGTELFEYHYERFTKESYVFEVYNEKYGQKITYVYTVAADQVDPDAVDNAQLLALWYGIFTTMHDGVVDYFEALSQAQAAAAGDGDGDGGDGGNGGTGVTTQGAGGRVLTIQRSLTTQGVQDILIWLGINTTQWTAEGKGIIYDMDNFQGDSNKLRNDPKYSDPMSKEYWDNQIQKQKEGKDSGTVGGYNNIAPKFELHKESSVNLGTRLGPIPFTAAPDSAWTYIGPLVPVDGISKAWKDFINDPRWNRKEWNAERDYQEFSLEIYKKRLRLPYSMSKWDKKTINAYSKRYKREEREYKQLMAANPRQIHDPSGIVYEAVLSNPVEGATVKLYTYNPAAALAEMDPAQFVDSTQFGIEENPQVTGADGRYQWFVPEGYWQVKVSKAGYESFSTGDWGHQEQRPTFDGEYNLVLDGDGNPVMSTVWVGDFGIDSTKDFDGDGVDDADTYWMPVLPIQLDVNIPLVSQEAPVLASAEASESGVTVAFSKYMRPETVAASQFAIGGKAPASVTALDAEAAGDGSLDAEGNPAMYARIFKLAYPSGWTFVAGVNDVPVHFAATAGGAASYAGTSVSEDADFACSVNVPAISVSGAAIAAVGNQVYTGKAIAPTPKVTVGGKVLVKGTDYTLGYKNNTAVGTATITVTGKGRYNGSASTTFKIVRATQSVTVSGKSVTVGQTVKLGAKASAGGKLSYKSANEGIAKVSADGTVTPVGAGTVKITITAAQTATHNAASTTVSVTVNRAAQSISAQNKQVAVKKTVKLGAKASGDGKLAYKSSNSKVATVSAQGVVTGKAAGTAKITITAAQTSRYGKATKTVTVKVVKTKNPITAKSKKATVSVALKKVKKAKQVLASNFTVKKAQGKVAYVNASTNAKAKKFKVNAKTGKLTVPKGTKKGIYQVVVKVKAAGNSAYLPGTKTVKFKVKVK